MPGKARIWLNGATTWSTERTDSGFWVSESKNLGIVLQSNSGGEVMEDIGCALELLINDLQETGELDAFAKKQGWSIVPVEDHENIPPVAPAYGWMPAPDQENQISIPLIPFLPERASGQA